MYGNHRPRFPSGGGGGPPPQPQPQPQQPQLNPSFAFQNPNIYFPNPALQLFQNLTNISLQNPNLLLQNPNFLLQNPNLLYQQFPYNPNTLQPQTQIQTQGEQFPRNLTSNLPQTPTPTPTPSLPQPQKPKKEVLERIDRAVLKARNQIIEAGEGVTAWKVCQSAALLLKVDSWSSLGFQMQEVPSLRELMITEAKINAFIHCFVGVRKITTLYDLEEAICKNESIGKFEELELGPFLRHQLVMHYFSVNYDVTEVVNITNKDIIICLSEYMDTHKKKDIETEEFLDFIAKKRSLASKEKLGVRIQNLGMHIKFIREARISEDVSLRNFWKRLQPDHKSWKRLQPDHKSWKRPIYSSYRKKKLDERFSVISERVKSFSSVHEDFCGKHIRFVSSSSGDDDSNDCTDEDNNDVGSHLRFPSQTNSSDRMSSCPYPSATEELTRLGLKDEINGQLSPAGDSSRQDGNSGSSTKKRKFEKLSRGYSAPAKLHKKDKVKKSTLQGETDHAQNVKLYKPDISLSHDSMRLFITTWKEACKDHTAEEVFERMIQFYISTYPKKATRQVKRLNLKLMLSSYPFVGLLNTAVASIKFGMWDSVYDTLQAIGQHELTNKFSDKCSEYENIEIEPSKMVAVVNRERIVHHTHSVTVEDIMRKVCTYFEFDHDDIRSKGWSHVKNIFILLRKLCNCGTWLAEQFSVKEFKSLGYGEFFLFLEKYASLLPTDLQKLLAGNMSEKSSFEVSLLQHLLVVLVSQASNSLRENELITKEMISTLLMRQFPLLSFKIMDNGSMDSFLEIVGKYRNDVISKCVLFSETLLGMSTHKENALLETNEMRTDSGVRTRMSESVTSKDAVEVLLRAPMLSDLTLWSHWNLVFAPSLGPLLEWLLNEVNAKELLCLVTKDGKVIRLDTSATVDSFFEAALEGSAFQTAVNLLSSFALAGGEKHVPLSLLKCHARHAFEVIFKNNIENVEGSDGHESLMHEKVLSNQQMLGEVSADKLSGDVRKHSIKLNKAMTVASRFFIDCLGYMPSEVRGFAADVLLSGLRSVIKNAPIVILSECNQTDQRLMLHEVGLSLGIVEWVNDYHAFCSTATTELFKSCGASCLKATRSEFSTGSRSIMQNASNKLVYTEAEMIDFAGADGCNEEGSEVSRTTDGGEASGDGIENCCTQLLSEFDGCKDAALIIESIRQEEFGLDSSLSNMESSMLKKQHARLGRALHCLSQELYSQDSHFLLELVQNADDNMYPENLEPTLAFILQESGIVVLNNELGFSAQNIRALCDVGNSTKKGSGGGYIGQKGIGFKSVFRVTDAPEIHSNGFHVKFDISEGQIGFVLPNVVPPCNIAMLSRLASKDPIQLDNSCWNTCIRLPFRSKLSEGIAIHNIVAMFSDLHPSLLLFLHRLQCIVFRNLLNDSLIVMKKETVGNGIIKVSCGEDKMTWFVTSKKLQADVIRSDVQTTEIAIAFTLQEINGNYSPLLDQQPVFAFLPLRTYGLKFILQGDFVLPSSREEVDGNSPWNQWLLSEFPGLFVSAEKSFCDLPCFRENPAKAVAAYMSFVPLVGEVHGFFSCLPRMIISKLRMSNCLLLEGGNNHWVPPCKVLRGWNDEARDLLPDSLLHDHLGLGYLNKDIVLSDSLARALGIEEYGPKVLLQIVASLCGIDNGLKSMGLSWLSSWLNAFYTVSFHSSGQSSLHSGKETDIINKLQKIPFIPLSDGTFSSVDEGTIWLHSDGSGFDGGFGFEAFPNLYAKLRTVSLAFFSASAFDISCLDGTSLNNLTRMLLKIGVQQLSAHDIVKVHILPAISDELNINRDKNLMIDYLCFVMIHLQSSCPNCHVEREYIFSELRNKAFILTNHAFKRPSEVSIHFGKEFGNPVDVKKLINALDIKWHEVDISYLKHPATESLSNGLIKWRSFFQEIGVTDFVKVVQVDKSVADISLTVSKGICDRELVSPISTAKDWESIELVHLLSQLSTNVNRESCKYLLEILDTLWDDCYSDKTTGYCNFKPSGDGTPFKSSFMCNMYDVQWAVSSMDDELHYPKDLFHDCDAVRSILGASAPYLIPKVKSEKLLCDIGLKTEVTISDILDILKVWRSFGTPFKASIAQMSRLYTYIWNEMAASKHKIAEELLSESFIFVPYTSGFRHEDVVSGVFLSSEEVYWHDSTGTIDLMKEMQPQCSSIGLSQYPLTKTLCSVYPGLHEFFVKRCGVPEGPSFRSYVEILLELSTVALPSQAANAVFQVLLRWAEAMKSGLLSSEDVIHLKDCLVKLEYTVLPTSQDKWVSLHPSFGLVCWCDDNKLRKRFKHLDSIDFLYFGKLGDHEQEMLQTKVSTLMQTIGIPTLSEVVTREAIYYGLVDGSFKSSLVNWALPYAQRYIFSVHPDKYHKLKQFGFDTLNHLQIVVVEKLFYRNVIKSNDGASKKRYKCSYLLQGNILYTTQASDSHALYMGLSCLFFDGSPELHLANFLHMITTMVESGSTEEQMEFFILNSQKVPKLPAEEFVWSLPSAPSLTENDKSLQTSFASSEAKEQNSSEFKRKVGVSSNWPPVDWKTAPDFSYARANGFKTQAAVSHASRMINSDDDEDVETQKNVVPIEIDATLPIGDELAMTSAALILPDAKNMDGQLGQTFNHNGSSMNVVLDPADKGPKVASSKFNIRDRLNTGAPNVAQALQTGKEGELAAFKHFTGLLGKMAVKWVNEINETGLPYDIVIGEKESEREYIEVKATKSARKDWFNITMREWQFAVEKGETFSVAHVLLSDGDPKVTVYKNPVKLCQHGKLQLVVMMPR
ncbi:hypothetical protein ACOSQ4_006562 [Xanthoceras sorbifolium]